MDVDMKEVGFGAEEVVENILQALSTLLSLPTVQEPEIRIENEPTSSRSASEQPPRKRRNLTKSETSSKLLNMLEERSEIEHRMHEKTEQFIMHKYQEFMQFNSSNNDLSSTILKVDEPECLGYPRKILKTLLFLLVLVVFLKI